MKWWDFSGGYRDTRDLQGVPDWEKSWPHGLQHLHNLRQFSRLLGLQHLTHLGFRSGYTRIAGAEFSNSGTTRIHLGSQALTKCSVLQVVGLAFLHFPHKYRHFQGDLATIWPSKFLGLKVPEWQLDWICPRNWLYVVNRNGDWLVDLGIPYLQTAPNIKSPVTSWSIHDRTSNIIVRRIASSSFLRSLESVQSHKPLMRIS